MGAIMTCPLEVVKTRLQSSNSGFIPPSPPSSSSGTSVSSSKPSTSISGAAIRQAILAPDLAVVDRRGPLQITVPVANTHSRASMSSSIISKCCSTSTVPSPQPPRPQNIGVFTCLR